MKEQLLSSKSHKFCKFHFTSTVLLLIIIFSMQSLCILTINAESCLRLEMNNNNNNNNKILIKREDLVYTRAQHALKKKEKKKKEKGKKG